MPDPTDTRRADGITAAEIQSRFAAYDGSLDSKIRETLRPRSESIRSMFLRALEEHVPDAFRSLMEEVLPVARKTGRPFPLLWRWRSILLEQSCSELAHALRQWARSFHLVGVSAEPVPWMMDVAADTLHAAMIDPSLNGFMRPTEVWNLAELPSPPLFPTASGRDWRDYRKQCHAILDQHLRELRTALREQRGIGPEKREYQHVVWLVQKQVLGCSLSEIAKKSRAGGRSTVSSQLKVLAGSLGFALARRPAGRPRNSPKGAKGLEN